MKKFLLVRHGTTEWVDKHILHGITDIPLNDNGLRQAREAAAALKGIQAGALYTSPLTRCMQTAGIIGEQLKLTPTALNGLKEINFGWLEGRPFREHGDFDFGPLVRLYDHFNHRVIRALSGEPQKKFYQRVLEAWQQILDENADGTSVIVGHSAVFNTILIHHFGMNFPAGHMYYAMAPGSINEIQIDERGEATLARLNDTAHLSRKSG